MKRAKILLDVDPKAGTSEFTNGKRPKGAVGSADRSRRPWNLRIGRSLTTDGESAARCASELPPHELRGRRFPLAPLSFVISWYEDRRHGSSLP